jgi:hypothetical protein
MHRTPIRASFAGKYLRVANAAHCAAQRVGPRGRAQGGRAAGTRQPARGGLPRTGGVAGRHWKLARAEGSICARGAIAGLAPYSLGILVVDQL